MAESGTEINAALPRRTFLQCLCAGAIAGPLSSRVHAEEDVPRPPNIVLFLSDDHGLHQVGCYRDITGNSFYETPNIDRLAFEGMRFENGYSACPVCSPTRASIMTGKYPARLHLTDYIAGSEPKNARLLQPDWTKYLPLEEVTIAEALKQCGYVTGHFGKWHLNKDYNYAPGRPMDPGSQGFDEVVTARKPNRTDDPNADPHSAWKTTDAALGFIEKNKDRPFFCYIPHNLIHNPFMEKAENVAKYQAKPGSDRKENDPVVGAMVETLDKNVGRVLDKLDALNLTENTLVIFTGDNGASDARDVLKPLRGGKAQLYEGGIHVAFLARWPRAIKAGSRSRDPIISNDLFPTLRDAAAYGKSGAVPSRAQGAPTSDSSRFSEDSRSLVPLFQGAGTLQRDAIYWHYPHYHSLGLGPCGAMRKGRYKLIEWYEKSLYNEPGNIELYDLEQDISEQHDLAQAQPELAAELLEEFRAWKKQVGAQEMTKNPNYIPEKGA